MAIMEHPFAYMTPAPVYCFVDGGHLLKIAQEADEARYDPQNLASTVTRQIKKGIAGIPLALSRTLYYDAKSKNPTEEDEAYWKSIEALNDTHVDFGWIRGEGEKKRQKAVDTRIAVDMLVGAFTGVYRIAILIAGDGDYVPAVREVRRAGPHVIVAARRKSISKELRDTADRFIELPKPGDENFSTYFQTIPL